MTIEQFVNEYSFLAMSLDKIASLMLNEVDDAHCREVATEYLDAQRKFLRLLDEIDFEIG